MGRAGYTDDFDDHWSLIRWRGVVASAMRGKRGQAFLRELIASLDALPEKRLIADALVEADGAVCAIGSVGKARGIDMQALDPDDYDQIADAFGINHALVREIEYMNDEWGAFNQTPEQRWTRMREWAELHLIERDETP